MMQVPIRVYYHVTLINHWEEVTKYVFDKIVESGLGADMAMCYVVALGDDESELAKLKDLISKYSKTELRDWHKDKGMWEGQTLKHLFYDAHTQEKFYAIYCHSKSITYPKEGDGKGKTPAMYASEIFWMRYMVWGVIERWRDNYAALSLPDKGYDVAGVRAIPLRESASIVSHFSGNFWMANSEYLKTLPRISDDESLPDVTARLVEIYNELKTLAKTGRIGVHGHVFWPEIVIGLGQPLMYISANSFTVGFPTPKTCGGR